MKSWENKPLTQEEKEKILSEATQLFDKLLRLYGWDIDSDPNMKETPYRIAKSWFEIFRGSFEPPPPLKVFPLDEMEVKTPVPVFVGPIRIYSMCSHHFLPIIGYAYVEYHPSKNVLGLSKIPRLVQWISRRPAIQEKLTEQIVRTIFNITKEPCFCLIEAKHLCTCMRGVEEENATMITESAILYNEDMLRKAKERVSLARKEISF